MKTNLKWLLLILTTSILFFWKLVLTDQFSILMQQEQANQTYCWYHFSAASLQQGILPLWDPYTHAGRTFVGGMETGLFYPPKLLLYFWPLDSSGLFSLRVFHVYYVLTHVLAAFFLFVLARELGLGTFPSFVASLCFSLAGFMSRIPWSDMLDSAIWLPLILLFLIRAWRSTELLPSLLNAGLAGLCLGMAILAGRIHIVMMDVLAILGAAVWFPWHWGRSSEAAATHPQKTWIRTGLLVAVAGVIAIGLGAVQLLPSMEYSRIAVRYIGAPEPMPATEKIKYADLRDEFQPRALLSLLFGQPFAGSAIGGEMFSLYLGVMPLILAVIGAKRYWQHPWVRFLSGLAVVAFAFSLGPWSLVHGLSYVLVPFLWMARGAARFVYLVHFAMAILAGFGVEALFARERDTGLYSAIGRTLKWIVIVTAAAVSVPALFAQPDVNEWIYISFLLMLASYALFVYLNRAPRALAGRIILIALILFDLHVFYWIIQNRDRVQRAGGDYLHALLQCRDVAAFLKNQPGLFRVHMAADGPPNIGDLYGVQITECWMATELGDYLAFRSSVPRAFDLLNVRYIVRPGSAGQPGPVYRDAGWKVYENPTACPRAWIVHNAVVETAREQVLMQLQKPGFDPLETAVVGAPLEVELQARPVDAQDRVEINLYRPDRIELTAHAASRGLLVLSEVHYPGWRAYLNGESVKIRQVNGLLRGIVIPAGTNRIEMRYAPRYVYVGAALGLLALACVAALALAVRRR
jgi:hypothetical protein